MLEVRQAQTLSDIRKPAKGSEGLWCLQGGVFQSPCV